MPNALETYIKNQVLLRSTNLNDDLSYNGNSFRHRGDFNDIKRYVDDFIEGKTINRYLVLPGIRDAGKSTILFQVYEYLFKQKNIPPRNILYLAGDNLKYMCNSSIMEGISKYLEIYHNGILETVSEPIFLLIDKAQYDESWSMTGKLIFDSSKNIFMIFSGSSALELSYNADSARRLLKIPITPLNFPEHLNLKYGGFDNELSKPLIDLIFDGEINDACDCESQLMAKYSDLKNFDVNEWVNYLKFGGFPSSFHQNHNETIKKIVDIVERVVTVDMKSISGLNGNTQDLAFQLLYYFALQSPGEISKESLANTLDSNKMTISKLIDTLEKTQLIFHISSFSSSPKRTTKPNKYYFATSSLKNVLSINLGNASLEDESAYMGKLFENFVASSFFNLNNKSDVIYKTYYDSSKKGEKNVDFIVQKGLNTPVPIEVSYGKKNRSQIKHAMKRYESNHGIIISNTTSHILRKGNVIYLPCETFSYM